jgi:hypothetical protein
VREETEGGFAKESQASGGFIFSDPATIFVEGDVEDRGRQKSY